MTIPRLCFPFAVLALCVLPRLCAAEGLPADGDPFFARTNRQFGMSDEALLEIEILDARIREDIHRAGGVDIALYRVYDPIEFLRAQKNLHRIEVGGQPRGEGIADTLAYLWGNAWNESREAWHRLFAPTAEQAATDGASAPEARIARPDERPAVRFGRLDGFEFIDRFRYPLMAARPVGLAGDAPSADSGKPPPLENGSRFHVPLGKLRPGLYIAEAFLGPHRAMAPVFVSDTVAVSKSASGTLRVWAAHRKDGRAVLGTTLQWTDGRGAFVQAKTDVDGLARFTRIRPEHAYLFGRDAVGGVFISENFHSDSDPPDPRLYTVTDRPLYHPGDEVDIKFIARGERIALPPAPERAEALAIGVYGPDDAPVWTGSATPEAGGGAEAAFRLPPDALAGEHSIRTTYRGKTHDAVFHVAHDAKPHLEIAILPARDDFKTGDPLVGTIRLAYPNGDPVKNAPLELALRAQALTMEAGETRVGELRPVPLPSARLTSDEWGEARFTLPPVQEPSRLLLSVRVADEVADPVRATRELRVERDAFAWKLTGERAFSLVGAPPRFRLEPASPGGEGAAPPVQWEIIRREDQTKTSGVFETGLREWTPVFERPGAYSLRLRDGEGRLVAVAAHWVGGEAVEHYDQPDSPLPVRPGTLAERVRAYEAPSADFEIVTDKARYQPGETADILLIFPMPVGEALLTLERDQVERTALLSAARTGEADWVRGERIAPNQWRMRVPIVAEHAPNVILSALYVKNGGYAFRNVALVVDLPRLALDIRAAPARARPGDIVTVDIDATLDGQATPAMLTVSVVDEKVYALQPETVPGIVEFFRNIHPGKVRTRASLDFIAPVEAAPRPPARPPHTGDDLGIGRSERVRRDDAGTAAWQPALATDENGHARFSFRMPDALSRWRITVRAVALDDTGAARPDGVYGQRIAHVQSGKPLHAEWLSPRWMREGDAPVATLALFNDTDETRTVEAVLDLAGREIVRKATLPRGLAYLAFPLPSFTGVLTARLDIRDKDGTVDTLETPLQADPPHWRAVHERIIALEHGAAPLALPADARRLRLRLAAGAAEHFPRIADALIESPRSDVEHTASRLIALALVLAVPPEASGREEADTVRLRQMLHSQRLRLAALAGPDGVFGEGGEGGHGHVFTTAYAHYADWLAARALGIDLPAARGERVRALYREHAHEEPVLHRALSLWLMQQTGLPVHTPLKAVRVAIGEAEASAATAEADAGSVPPVRAHGDTLPAEAPAAPDTAYSPLLVAPDGDLGLACARVLVAVVAAKTGDARHDGKTLARARRILRDSPYPLARALRLLDGDDPATRAPALLAAT
ncbi:MAG: hypothetical protein LBP86_06540, partial [Azoarcus sp.]|nr:hypothetical protein [Azoarcus sp.]